jgi:hypothetical protein
MTFGQAMAYGALTVLGLFGAAFIIHFTGDLYDRTIRRGLLKPTEPSEEPPPSNGTTVSGIYSLYHRR